MADPIDVSSLPFLVVAGGDEEWIVLDLVGGEYEVRDPLDLAADGTPLTIEADFTSRGMTEPEIVPTLPIAEPE